MTEALYRGRRVDNGRWVYGSLIAAKGTSGKTHTFIFPVRGLRSITKICLTVLVEVDPMTVGQYTGLNDKNDKKLFDGDICRVIYSRYFFTGYREIEFTAKVVYENGGFFFDHDDGGFIFENDSDEIEIIGNIFNNPDLLEVTK